MSYIGTRRARLNTFKQDIASRNISGAQLDSEWGSYSGRERVLLRKRRTKLQMSGFHIITQVGQGGYVNFERASGRQAEADMVKHLQLWRGMFYF